MASNLDFRVKNGLVVVQTATFISTANAVSTITGAVQLAGGAGIAKDLWVGGNVNVAGTINASVTGVITSATNIANGTAGQIPYQSAVGVTNFAGPGTAGQVLVSQGASTSGPVFQNTLTLAGSTAATSTQTGALVVVGGVGIGQNLYVNDNTVLGTNYNNTATGSKITFRGIVQTATVSAIVDTTQNVVMALPMNNWQIVATDGNYVRPVIAKDTGNNLSIGISGSTYHSDVNIYGGPSGNINFYSGTPNYRSYFDQFGRFFITTTTQVVSPTTGALQVSGGVGVAGSMFVGGVVTATNFFVNGFPVTTGTAVTLLYNGTNLGNINTLNFGTGTFVTFQNTTGTIWVNTATLMQYAVNLSGGGAGRIPYQSATNATAFVAAGTPGQLLVSRGTSAPTFISTGTEGGVLVSKPNGPQFVSTTTVGAILVSQGLTPVYISTGTAGSLLMSRPGVPEYVTTSNIYVNSAVYADDLTGGSAGSLPYQSAANTTIFLAGGTNGNNLRYFNNAPVWSTTGTFSGGTADSTAVGSQSVTITNGGLGVSGNSHFASDLGVGGILGANNTNASVVTAASNSFYTLGGAWVEKTLLINAKTNSSSTNSGALQVVGGLGVWLNAYIGGDLNVGGTVSAANIFGSITTASNLAAGVAGAIPYQSAPGITNFSSAGTVGQVLLSGGTGSPTWAGTTTLYVNRANFTDNVQGGTTGAIVYQSNANTTAFVSLSGTQKSLLTAGASAPVYVTQVQAQSGTGSASAASGQSLVVTGGGLGVTGDSYFANDFGVGGATTLTGKLQINSAADATGTNAALYVAGAGWFGKGMTVNGDSTFNGNTIFNGTSTNVFSTNTVYTDNFIDLHYPAGAPAGGAWTFDDGKDIGHIYHHYNPVVGDEHGALIWHNSSDELRWYMGGVTYVGGAQTYDFSTGTYGTFRTGAIRLSGGTNNSGNTSTGDLTVLGGAGFGGNVWIQGALNVQGGVNAVINGTITTATNLSGGAAGTLVYQSAPGLTAYLSTGSTGQFLQANFGGAPIWTSTGSMYVNRAFYADDLIGGGSGAIVYQASPDNTQFLSTGTPGQLLSAAVGAPAWVNTSSLLVGYAVNKPGGAAGSIVYQSGASASTFLAIGAAGTFLRSTGSAPQWASTATALFGYAQNLAGGSAGQFVYQSAANTTAFISTGSMYVDSARVADNLRGGVAGSIPIQTANGVTAFITTSTPGYVLTMGTNDATWQSLSGLASGSATTATNLANGTAGQVPYQTAVGATSFFGPGTAGQILVSAGAAAPVYTNTGSIYVNSARFADEITGGSAGALVYQAGASDSTFLNLGTQGFFLTAGASAPQWSNTATALIGYASNIAGGSAGQFLYQSSPNTTAFISTGSMFVNSARFADNVTGGAAGSIVYQSAANTTAMLAIGTNGFVLTSNGTSPVWQAISGLSAGSATTATNLAGGTAGQVPYQTAAGSTSFFGPGTAGQLLQSNGTSAPGYVNTTSIYVGRSIYTDDVFGGGNGSLLYQPTANDTQFLSTGTPGQILTAAVGAPAWVSTSTLFVGRAAIADKVANALTAGTGLTGSTFDGSVARTWTLNTATLMQYAVNVTGGAAGSLVYQSAANTTAMLGLGTAGFVLTAGATAPQWTPITGLTAGEATTSTQVKTQSQPASATYYPTFVDSNNAAQTGELVYTTSSFTINPAGGQVGVASNSGGYALAVSNAGAGSADRLFINMTGAVNSFSIYENSQVAYLNSYNSMTLRANQLGGSGGAINLTGGNVYIANNLGVGQASPTQKLEVAGAIKVAGTAVTAVTLGTGGAVLDYTYPTTRMYIGDGTGWDFRIARRAASATTDLFTFLDTGGLGFNGSYGSSGQVLQSNGTGSPTWVNVSGIGAGSATTASQVNTVLRTTSADHYVTFVDSNNATSAGELVYTTSTLVVNPGTVRVGVGTSPSTTLHVKGGLVGEIARIEGTTGRYIYTGIDGLGQYIEQVGTAAGERVLRIQSSNGAGTYCQMFWDGANRKIYTDAGSFVGIGHSTQYNSEILGVNGKILAGSASSTNGSRILEGLYSSGHALTVFGTEYSSGGPAIGYGAYPSSAASGSWLSAYNVSALARTGQMMSDTIRWYTGASQTVAVGSALTMTQKMQLSNAGGLSVGTAADAGAGGIFATGEVTAYYSDRRLKTDVKPIDNAVEKVLSLNGILYKPNEIAGKHGFDTTKQVVGLFADEVEAVLPEATKPAPFDLDKDGNSISGENYKTVQYEKLVPLLVEAIKQQQEEIAQLREIVNKLATK